MDKKWKWKALDTTAADAPRFGIGQEVEAMCDRVVLIRLGEIVADAPLADMLGGPGGLEAQFKSLTA